MATDELKDYRQGQTIYLLLSAQQCHGVVNDWNEAQYECDLRVSRSKKNPGCYVVETRSLMWATRIIKWFGCMEATWK